MSYDPTRQYRCAIIRGKSKSDLDNLLISYARTVNDTCPCPKEVFAERFNFMLGKILGTSVKKTLDNHRTEIVGKLFGMFYVDADNNVQIGERTRAFLDNLDQPFFFKDVCYKLQFPNGMDKLQTVQERIDRHISVRPLCFVLSVVKVASDINIALQIDEIAYYVLNSLDALQGRVSAEKIVERIKSDRQEGIHNLVHAVGKASSYNMQHINELLSLLELANLISIRRRHVYLNLNESATIELFIKATTKSLLFKMEQYDLTDKAGKLKMYADWSKYYSDLSIEAQSNFITSVAALGVPSTILNGQTLAVSGTKQLGDDGEEYIYQYEKKRVSTFNSRLAGKVKHVGQQRGLGYDILSVVAERGGDEEFAMYLEVKSTKRVTAPDPTSDTWTDQVGVTRNEWIAAQQHGAYYRIYRVYFTASGVHIFIVKNPYQKVEDGIMFATAMQYSVEFNGAAVDFTIKE